MKGYREKAIKSTVGVAVSHEFSFNQDWDKLCQEFKGIEEITRRNRIEFDGEEHQAGLINFDYDLSRINFENGTDRVAKFYRLSLEIRRAGSQDENGNPWTRLDDVPEQLFNRAIEVPKVRRRWDQQESINLYLSQMARIQSMIRR